MDIIRKIQPRDWAIGIMAFIAGAFNLLNQRRTPVRGDVSRRISSKAA